VRRRFRGRWERHEILFAVRSRSCASPRAARISASFRSGVAVSAATLLSRLDRVRESGPGKWRARCPAHDGKSLSLAVAEVDGRVLLKCFAGCETSNVLGALGLRMADLFEKPLDHHAPLQRSPWSARDVLELALVETTVVGIVASDFLQRRSIGEQDWRRLAAASARLKDLANAVRS